MADLVALRTGTLSGLSNRALRRAKGDHPDLDLSVVSESAHVIRGLFTAAGVQLAVPLALHLHGERGRVAGIAGLVVLNPGGGIDAFLHAGNRHRADAALRILIPQETGL